MRPFRQLLILIGFSIVSLCATEVTIVELELQDDSITLISQRGVQKTVKRSRSAQRGGRSGAASEWKWEFKDGDGTLLARSYFANPTILCTGDHSAHIELDSTRFTLSIPSGVDGELSIVREEGAAALLVGTIEKSRTKGELLGIISIKGGK